MLYSIPMFIALMIDVVIGWPDPLFRMVGHPVTWLGALIAALEQKFNRTEWAGAVRRLLGVATLMLVVGAAAVPAAVLQMSIPTDVDSMAVVALAAWPFVAARSLRQHVAAVAVPLSSRDLAGARAAVAMIVGRDTANLDAAAVSRAAIESLAENTSDAVAAPLFWGALLGLPGICAYKAINTLDSMIGHRSERFEEFGWASARIDDLANWAPARITAVLIAVVSARPLAALSTVAADAKRHRSPNAGFPEAAMAGALGVRLSGPRIYGNAQANEPWLNANAADPCADDVRRALRVYERAVLGIAVLLGALALL